jgi:tRNA dimethylallyltransferase
MKNKYLVIILGPTGAGKTDLSISLALHFRSEIISADSRQFYRELRIGTAAPTDDQLRMIRHHFIGHLSVKDYFNVSMFEVRALRLLEELYSRMDIVFVCGGSGLYINVLCHGIDQFPEVDHEIRETLLQRYREQGLEGIRRELERADPLYYGQVDLNNPGRILKALEVYYMTGAPYSAFLGREKQKRPFAIIKIGLNMDRRELYERINHRVDRMMASGLVEEARSLQQYRDTNALNTVGYKEVFRYLDGELSLEEATALIKRNSRRYARRQLTWFRKDRDTRWFSPGETEKIIDYIEQQYG